ncbi:MAG: helix-turn-helix domain-containing protein [Dysgonomonas sp.]
MNIFDLVIFYYVLTFATSFTIIILAVMLLNIHIQINEKLYSFNLSKKYLSLSYFILGISGLISFFSQQETENKLLLASSTLIVASYQALLFTYTILALIQPLYIKRKQILVQLGVITSTGIFLFLTLFFVPHFLHTLFFYIVVSAYLFQIAYYTYLFRLRYNECLRSLEEYYEDDEQVRLRWVKFSFYGALTIGIFALISLFLNLYFYILFSILYTVYYAYMVSRFYNYQIDFKFAIPVINIDIKKEENKETIHSNTRFQTEKCEQFGIVLDKWIEEKKFTQKDISVDEIAGLLDVNRSFLQYYFRTYMQTDFRTWRSELRIREAQTILKENPEISLEEIRELVGFNHRANFHQQFQKIIGITPSEYRKQQSKK